MHKFCFYLDWSGFEPEVWAAWAQAILSAAAIYWASRLAKRQDRLAHRRKADACIGLITHARDILAAASNDPLSRTNLTSIATLAKQMEGISLDATPDYRLIIAINTAENTVAVLNGELSAWSKDIHENEPLKTASAKRDVKSAITAIDDAYEDAIVVANELSSPSLKQRFRAWKFKRSKRAEVTKPWLFRNQSPHDERPENRDETPPDTALATPQVPVKRNSFVEATLELGRNWALAVVVASAGTAALYIETVDGPSGWEQYLATACILFSIAWFFLAGFRFWEVVSIWINGRPGKGRKIVAIALYLLLVLAAVFILVSIKNLATNAQIIKVCESGERIPDSKIPQYDECKRLSAQRKELSDRLEGRNTDEVQTP